MNPCVAGTSRTWVDRNEDSMPSSVADRAWVRLAEQGSNSMSCALESLGFGRWERRRVLRFGWRERLCVLRLLGIVVIVSCFVSLTIR